MSGKWLMWVCCGVMVLAGGYLLWSRGYQNILSYAVLLLCPLMHIVMMRGHGHDHGQHKGEGQGGPEENSKRPSCH